VVTACRSCNARKGNRTNEEAGIELLALPYRPSRIQWLLLSGKRILADQQAFLESILDQEGENH